MNDVTRLDLLCFRFRGGNKSEYRTDGATEQPPDEWWTFVQKIVRTEFPTKPSKLDEIGDMAFVNCPGFSDGTRIHCVYFKIQKARAFRNVFCFAYKTEKCPLEVLAGVSAEEWWNVCHVLNEQSTSVALPHHVPPDDLRMLEIASGSYLLYHFPDRRGDPVAKGMSKDEFDKLLQPPESKKKRQSNETEPILGKLDGRPKISYSILLWILLLQILAVLEGLAACICHVIYPMPVSPPNSTSGIEPYGTHCPKCMGAMRIVRSEQCPQCKGVKKNCSRCHSIGRVWSPPVDCPSCVLRENSKGRNTQCGKPSADGVNGKGEAAHDRSESNKDIPAPEDTHREGRLRLDYSRYHSINRPYRK